MSISGAATEDMVGVLPLEPEAIASSYPTSAWACNLKDSPMSLVILLKIRERRENNSGSDLPPYNNFVKHASPHSRDCRAQF